MAAGSFNPDGCDKRCPTPVLEWGMDNTETLVALMRAMRLDDPEMYEGLMALVSYVVDRRVDKKSSSCLTEEPE